MRLLGGHLGAQVAALVDGQLDPQDADRAWDHVLGCPSCRGAVERESWVKNRLSLMSPTDPPPGLTGALTGLGGDDAPVEDHVASAWATVGELEHRHRLRRGGLVAVGAGSASLALIGIGAFGGLLETPAPPGANETSISGGAESPASGVPTAQPVDHLAPAERRQLVATALHRGHDRPGVPVEPAATDATDEAAALVEHP
jgi:hypothetical protein